MSNILNVTEVHFYLINLQNQSIQNIIIDTLITLHGETRLLTHLIMNELVSKCFISNGSKNKIDSKMG